MDSKLNTLKKEIQSLADQNKAKIFQKFFKMGTGEYGEGDVFIGVTVPVLRNIASLYKNLDFFDLEILIKSKIHEERFTSLLILINKFNNFPENQKLCFDFYLNHIKNVNNWDLVDLSAPRILGAFLLDKSSNQRKLLYQFAYSENLWKRRISIVSTLAFIKNNDFKDAINISKILLDDREDLIQKAVGWVLREIGKKDRNLELEFIKENYNKISRTTLRSSIEKFQENTRQDLLKGIF